MDNLTKGALGATVVLSLTSLAFVVSNSAKEKRSLENQNAALLQQIQGDQKRRSDERTAELERKLEESRQESEAQLAALRREMAEAAAAASESSAIEAAERRQLNETLNEKLRRDEAELAKTLTPLQKKIRDASSIGKVTHVNQDLGFVVVGAGSANGIQEGTRFNVRRDMFIVAEVEISSVENERESVADIDITKLSPGLTLRPGDELIGHPIY